VSLRASADSPAKECTPEPPPVTGNVHSVTFRHSCIPSQLTGSVHSVTARSVFAESHRGGPPAAGRATAAAARTRPWGA
jgi:hypothetical protein